MRRMIPDWNDLWKRLIDIRFTRPISRRALHALSTDLRMLLMGLRFAFLNDHCQLEQSDVMQIVDCLENQVKAFIVNDDCVFFIVSRFDLMDLLHNPVFIDVSENEHPRVMDGCVIRSHLIEVLAGFEDHRLYLASIDRHLLPAFAGLILDYPWIYHSETDKTCLSQMSLKKISLKCCINDGLEYTISCYTVPSDLFCIDTVLGHKSRLEKRLDKKINMEIEEFAAVNTI